jgi:hypothetical protein
MANARSNARLPAACSGDRPFRPRALRRPRVPPDRPLSRRSLRHGDGRARRPQHLLLRLRPVGGRLEVRRRRREVVQRLRRLLRRLRGCRRRRRVRSQRDLRGPRREDGPRQRVLELRRLEVHRRGQELALRRPRGHAAHRPHPRPSDEPRHRLRRRHGRSLAVERGAGVYKSTDGGTSWEKVLFANEDAGAVDLVSRAGQSARALRQHLERAPHAARLLERRARAPISGRAPTPARPGRSSRTCRHARRAARHHRRDRLAREPGSGLGAHRGARTAACSAPTTPARAGRRSTATAPCAPAPGTTRASSPTRRTRTACT